MNPYLLLLFGAGAWFALRDSAQAAVNYTPDARDSNTSDAGMAWFDAESNAWYDLNTGAAVDPAITESWHDVQSGAVADGDIWADVTSGADSTAATADSGEWLQPTEPSPELIDWLLKKEGYSATRYLDPPGNSRGLYSIGYGHQVKPGEPYGAGYVMGRDEAYAVFVQDVKSHSAQIEQVRVPLTQGQYDALASFGFNAGPFALQSYGVLAALNDYDYDGAVAKMARINNAGTLTARRNAEAQIFNGGAYA